MAHRSTNVTNVAASVQARLKNLANQSGQSFAELLLLYTLEGFLRRLAHSPYRNHFALKGGLFLQAVQVHFGRSTRDLDLLGMRLPVEPESIATLIRDICSQSLPENDGLHFEPESLRAEAILEENDYQGVRVKLYGYLDRSRSRIIIDVGSGDPIVPGPREFPYPTLLGQQVLTLQSYSLESLIAEKLHALVERALLTSRLKDCYDLWLLSQQQSFDGALLQHAIQATFSARSRAFTSELPTILTPAFAENSQKQEQWEGFRRDKNAATAPASLAEALAPIITFLKPIWEASAAGQPFSGSWDATASAWRADVDSQPPPDSRTSLPHDVP